MDADCANLGSFLSGVPFEIVGVDNLPVKGRLGYALMAFAGAKGYRDILNRALVALETFLGTVGAEGDALILKIELDTVEVHPGCPKDNGGGTETGNKELGGFEMMVSGSDGEVDFVGNVGCCGRGLFAVKGLQAPGVNKGNNGKTMGLREIVVDKTSGSKGVGNSESLDFLVEYNRNYCWSRIYWSLKILK